MSDNTEIKIDAARLEKMRQAAKDCPTTKKALETIFPEAFPPVKKYCCRPFMCAIDTGGIYPVNLQSSTKYYGVGDRWMEYCPFCGKKL